MFFGIYKMTCRLSISQKNLVNRYDNDMREKDETEKATFGPICKSEAQGPVCNQNGKGNIWSGGYITRCRIRLTNTPHPHTNQATKVKNSRS